MSDLTRHWIVVCTGCIEPGIQGNTAYASLEEAIAAAKRHTKSASCDCHIYEHIGVTCTNEPIYEHIVRETKKENEETLYICDSVNKCKTNCLIHGLPHTLTAACANDHCYALTDTCGCVPVTKDK